MEINYFKYLEKVVKLISQGKKFGELKKLFSRITIPETETETKIANCLIFLHGFMKKIVECKI